MAIPFSVRFYDLLRRVLLNDTGRLSAYSRIAATEKATGKKTRPLLEIREGGPGSRDRPLTATRQRSCCRYSGNGMPPNPGRMGQLLFRLAHYYKPRYPSWSWALPWGLSARLTGSGRRIGAKLFKHRKGLGGPLAAEGQAPKKFRAPGAGGISNRSSGIFDLTLAGALDRTGGTLDSVLYRPAIIGAGEPHPPLLISLLGKIIYLLFRYSY